MKVSVIIPIFNGSIYINRIMYTIKHQTYANVEYILVDDGSTDNSYDKIIACIKDLNKPIYVFKQSNLGISAARNYGLKEATGEYIMFMDQDDSMEDDCVETLLDAMVKENADMVIGGCYLVDGSNKVIDKWQLNNLNDWDKYRITAPWGRMFRREIIDNNNIHFLETKISEDLYFNILFMNFAKKIIVTSYIGYRWLYNTKSESRIQWKKIKEDRDPVVMLETLHSKMNADIWKKQEKDNIEYFFYKYLVWYILYVSGNSSACDIEKMYDRIHGWFINNYPGIYKNKLLKFSLPKGEKLSIRVIIVMFSLMERTRFIKFFLKYIRPIMDV